MSAKGAAGDSRDRVALILTRSEARTLLDVADYYHRSLRLVRHFVRLTSTSDVRAKYRFVADESLWLRRLAEAILAEMTEADIPDLEVSMTARSLIAYWGRLLASVTAPRSRRRLSPVQIEDRQRLASKLERGALSLLETAPEMLRQELASRRPLEAGWMRARLNLPA